MLSIGPCHIRLVGCQLEVAFINTLLVPWLAKGGSLLAGTRIPSPIKAWTGLEWRLKIGWVG